MSNVTNTCQGHCLHELVCERGQVRLDTPHDKAVLFGLQLIVKLLVQVVSDASVMVWPKMALFSAVDVPSRDEVQEGRYCGEALRFEPIKLFVLVSDVRCNLKLLPPGRTLSVLVDYPLDQVQRLLPDFRVRLPFNHLFATFFLIILF